jgi:hypothetical protein
MASSVVPRARRVSIRFLDRTEREFIVDDARPLQARAVFCLSLSHSRAHNTVLTPWVVVDHRSQHIAMLVGNQMGLRNAEEFSLQYRAPSAAHDAYEWLNPYRPLQVALCPVFSLARLDRVAVVRFVSISRVVART